MATSLSFMPICSFKCSTKPGIFIDNSATGRFFRVDRLPQTANTAKFQLLEVKAAESNPTTKVNSIVCSKCEGNGAIVCSQCEGNGVNSVDHFNGQFKAGGLCWLCRGKREILCGDCNGAGFLGGFMSTFED